MSNAEPVCDSDMIIVMTQPSNSHVHLLAIDVVYDVVHALVAQRIRN